MATPSNRPTSRPTGAPTSIKASAPVKNKKKTKQQAENSKFTTLSYGGKEYPTTKAAVAAGWTPEAKNKATWYNSETGQTEPMSQSSVKFPAKIGAYGGGSDRIQVTTPQGTHDISRDEYLGGLVTPETMKIDQELAQAKQQISSDVKLVNDANAGISTTAPQNQELASKVGQYAEPTVEQLAAKGQGEGFLSNIGEAAKGATGEAITYGVAGAAGGAVIGAPAAGVGAIPGAIIGGAGGAASGFVKGIYSGLKEEYNKDVMAEYTDYQGSLKNLKATIDNVNKGGDPLESVDLFNNELAKIDAEERRLKALNEHEWLSNGRLQLMKIQAFNDGQRERYITTMQLALQKPNKNAQFAIGEEGADTI